MSKVNKKRRGTIVFLIILFAIAWTVVSNKSGVDIKNKFMVKEQKVSYNEFLDSVNKKEVRKVNINQSKAIFSFLDNNGKKYKTDNPKTTDFIEFLLKSNVLVEESSSNKTYMWIGVLIPLALCIGLFIFVRNMMKDTVISNISKNSMTSIPNTVEPEKREKITFDNIAGNKSIKKDINFLIDFLKDPDKYNEIGARLPKGIIFSGPPGTGKTLLAKAVAGESNVHFIAVSGSDFVQMYVGVGAGRVRDLFSKARAHGKCIIFIDEIDAIGKKRGTGNNDEKDQTINALLTEMDGFNSSEGIIVIGATNRPETLDEALVRPGRFDRQIIVPLPTYEERVEILKLHSKNKKLSDNVNIDIIAKLTIGFSGAGLETLLNESAILAISKGKSVIEKEELDETYYKIIMKGDKKSTKDIKKEELELVAWHEAGHTLTTKLLTKKSVPRVTIIPSTSGAGGATFIIPEKLGLFTKRDLINEVKISYGGRIAEYLLSKDEYLITTGASQDIKQATNVIVAMIKEFGMTEEFGMLYVDGIEGVSDGQILQEAKIISKQIYEESLTLLSENCGLIKQLAEKLIDKETLDEEEIDEVIFKGKPLAKVV